MANYTYLDRMALKFLVRSHKLMLHGMVREGGLDGRTLEEAQELLKEEAVLRIESELSRLGPAD